MSRQVVEFPADVAQLLLRDVLPPPVLQIVADYASFPLIELSSSGGDLEDNARLILEPLFAFLKELSTEPAPYRLFFRKRTGWRSQMPL
jgi:hypothetical protein